MERRHESAYLEFSRKEKNGIVVCLLIVLFLIWLPTLYENFFPSYIPTLNELTEQILKLDSITENDGTEYLKKNYYGNNENDYESNPKNSLPLKPFPFDPNTLTEEGWRQMGLKEKTIRTIMNYTSRGGKFRKPDDISKIWGITDQQAAELIPFVKIMDDFSQTSKEYKYSPSPKNKRNRTVDINLCDSASLEQLPMIGDGLARRIIKYRESLGGFYSVSQIGEVFGLHDSVFQKIKPQLILSDKKIKKININIAQLDELKSHPYIRYKLANVIIQYRNQHGQFSRLDDLKKIILIESETYNKIINYISLD